MGFSRHEPTIRPIVGQSGTPIELFEICCRECGDDGSPFSGQSSEVQSLRGPFPTRDRAREIVTMHQAMTERDW